MSAFTKDDVQMASQFATTFATPSGQAVLKELDRMYFTKNLFVADDPFASHVNIGAHMVIAAIYSLIQLAHDPRAVADDTIIEES